MHVTETEALADEIRDRWSVAGTLAGWEEPKDVVLPDGPGRSDCECERCTFAQDETMDAAMLELVLRPVSAGDGCRLWHVLKIDGPEALARLRENFAAAGLPVSTLGDLRSACEAMVGRRLTVELLRPEGAFGGSDELRVVGPAAEATDAAVQVDIGEAWFGGLGPEDDIPCGVYEPSLGIPFFGGSVRTAVAA